MFDLKGECKMSYSSLWLIGKDFIGYEYSMFRNSWLFSPIVWDILEEKYLPKDKYGFTQRIIGSNGNVVATKINEIMNNSDNTYERVCWELANQQIFYSEDKKFVADCIKEFLEKNNSYDKSKEDGICVLQREHIIERWNEIADAIENIDEKETPYFVFKNTSVDDTVETWFSEYDVENEEYKDKPIIDREEYLTEFVCIANKKIQGFIPNNEYKDNNHGN